MLLRTTNYKYNIDFSGRSSYDIVNDKDKKLFTVETIEVEGYRYQEFCCTDTVIDKVTAHFDTQGQSAYDLMTKMISDSNKAFKHQLKLLENQNARLKRQSDPQWQEVCQAARLLTQNNFKKQAQKIVKDYLQNQK